jgi:hypothetical protein
MTHAEWKQRLPVCVNLEDLDTTSVIATPIAEEEKVDKRNGFGFSFSQFFGGSKA